MGAAANEHNLAKVDNERSSTSRVHKSPGGGHGGGILDCSVVCWVCTLPQHTGGPASGPRLTRLHPRAAGPARARARTQNNREVERSRRPERRITISTSGKEDVALRRGGKVNEHHTARGNSSKHPGSFEGGPHAKPFSEDTLARGARDEEHGQHPPSPL